MYAMPKRRKLTPQVPEFAHKEILPNGLRVLVHEMPWAQSVSARLLVKAGPRYEDEMTIGSAHYLEHMFFEGSQRYPTRRDLDRVVESRGGNHSAYTDKEYVMYQAKMPTDSSDFATEFVSELVFNPTMTEEAVEREKGIISAELRKSIDTPSQHKWHLLREHVWKGQSLGYNTLGTFASIESISRQDLIDYHQKFYTPNNSILIIAGNITIFKAIDAAYRDFGSRIASRNDAPYVPTPTQSIDKQVLIEERDIKQAHLLLAFATDYFGEASPELPQIQVLSKLLAKDIFHKFVYDLGFSYSASCYPWLVSDSGNIVITVEVAPEKTEEAVTKMVQEIKELNIDGASVQEAKAGIISDTLLNLADTDVYANFIGEQELYTGHVKTPEQVKMEIQNVSVEDVQRAKEMFLTRQNSAMVILGPVAQDNAEKIENMLKELPLGGIAKVGAVGIEPTSENIQ